MRRLSLFIILSWFAFESQEADRPCGDSSDITNIGIRGHGYFANSTFDVFSSACYGDVKKSLELLQKSTSEGEKCVKKTRDVIGELKEVCSLLNKVNNYNTLFQRCLYALDSIHRSMEKISKFASIISVIRNIRTVIMEEVLPMSMKTLEYAHVTVRKVVIYFERLLGHKDTNDLQNLLKEIKNKGTRACIDSTKLGKLLTNFESKVKTNQESSKVILQAMFESQFCANNYCDSSENSCYECGRANSYFATAFPLIKKWKENMEVCYTNMDDVSRIFGETKELNKIFDAGFNMASDIDGFLQLLSGSLEKSTKSFVQVQENLRSCCPCGRPNPKGCDEEKVKKATDAAVCPLHDLIHFQVDKLLSSIDNHTTARLKNIKFPAIYIDVYLLGLAFQITIPKFLQECFRKSSFKLKFSKLCSFPNKRLDVVFRSPTLPYLKYSSMKKTYASLPANIDSSCRIFTASLKFFGRQMPECQDRIAIGTSTCDPSSSDPNPGVDYCPCQREQENCVIWKRSDLKTCSSQCLEKNYKPGKDPSGKNVKMDRTHGYRFCDNLKFYCKISDIKVRNGTVKCANNYTFYGSKCLIIPDPGYICPVNVIECGSLRDPLKGVCWDYPFIECSVDDNKHFPICTCNNNNTFPRGNLVCQYGNAQGAALTFDTVLELRNTFSCFERLGLNVDIKKGCGTSMSPCLIQQPEVEPYSMCGKKNPITKTSTKRKETHADTKSIRSVGIAFFVIGLLSLPFSICLCVYIRYRYKKTDEEQTKKCKKLLIICLKYVPLVFSLSLFALGLMLWIDPEVLDDKKFATAFSIITVILVIIIIILVCIYKQKGNSGTGKGNSQENKEMIHICAAVLFEFVMSLITMAISWSMTGSQSSDDQAHVNNKETNINIFFKLIEINF